MKTLFGAPTTSNGRAHKGTSVFEVRMTHDYSMFKIMSDNRNLNLLHVKRLVGSFKSNHLVCPIIVNERYYVIDGQHRLRASEETGMPVYYIVIPGYGINEVQILNTHQKNWSKMDFLNMYCSEGVTAYLELKKFMDDFPAFGIQAAERIVTLKHSSGIQRVIDGKKMQMKDFEEGKLKIPSITKSCIIARKIMDFKDFFPEFHRGTFVSAIMPLFSNKNYNHKEMIHKLTTCPIKMTPCQNVEAYRLLLEDIYNYKRVKHNKVSFRYT